MKTNIKSKISCLFVSKTFVSERNVHILFADIIWAELSLLFWTFLSRTFFLGGGVHLHPVHPPAYAPAVGVT